MDASLSLCLSMAMTIGCFKKLQGVNVESCNGWRTSVVLLCDSGVIIGGLAKGIRGLPCRQLCTQNPAHKETVRTNFSPVSFGYFNRLLFSLGLSLAGNSNYSSSKLETVIYY